MPETLTASEIVRALGWSCRPTDIVNLFYRRVIRDETAPVVNRQRHIPVALISLIRSKLIAAGKLTSDAKNWS